MLLLNILTCCCWHVIIIIIIIIMYEGCFCSLLLDNKWTVVISLRGAGLESRSSLPFIFNPVENLCDRSALFSSLCVCLIPVIYSNIFFPLSGLWRTRSALWYPVQLIKNGGRFITSASSVLIIQEAFWLFGATSVSCWCAGLLPCASELQAQNGGTAIFITTVSHP